MSRASPGLSLAAALLMGAMPAAVSAQSEAESYRPTGPVEITADSADWTQGGVMVYTGEVKLSSDNLELEGDRLELRQFPDGQFEARVTGNPANLRHAGGRDAEGETQPPVSARARTLVYDSRTSIIEFNGQAHMTRGSDEIDGQTIRYNVVERRIQVAGGEGGRVRIVIQPNRPQESPERDAPNPKPSGRGS